MILTCFCEQVFVPDEMAASSVSFAATVLTISDALLYNSQAIEQVRGLARTCERMLCDLANAQPHGK